MCSNKSNYYMRICYYNSSSSSNRCSLKSGKSKFDDINCDNFSV